MGSEWGRLGLKTFFSFSPCNCCLTLSSLLTLSQSGLFLLSVYGNKWWFIRRAVEGSGEFTVSQWSVNVSFQVSFGQVPYLGFLWYHECCQHGLPLKSLLLLSPNAITLCGCKPQTFILEPGCVTPWCQCRWALLRSSPEEQCADISLSLHVWEAKAPWCSLRRATVSIQALLL